MPPLRHGPRSAFESRAVGGTKALPRSTAIVDVLASIMDDMVDYTIAAMVGGANRILWSAEHRALSLGHLDRS